MRKALLVTGVVLGLGLLLKEACGSKETYFYCYSDFQPLYIERQLGGGRFPYFPPALEYPSGIGLVVWATSAATSSAGTYYQLNIAILVAVGLGTTAMLVRLVGDRSLYFAASASLGLWGFVTWDLLPVALTVAAVSAYLSGRNAAAGALAGVGAATKVFPGLLAISLALDAMGDRRVVRLVLAFVGAVVALNLPIMVASFEGWAHFYQFSATRLTEPGSIWSAACYATGSDLCADPLVIDIAATSVFLAGLAGMIWYAARRRPDLPRWTLAFPLTIMFLLSAKVFSPQFSLWILPWFALAFPHLPVFLAYQFVDVGVYWTTFAYQQDLLTGDGLPVWPLHVFVVLRAALLIAMLGLFLGRRGVAASSPSSWILPPTSSA